MKSFGYITIVLIVFFIIGFMFQPKPPVAKTVLKEEDNKIAQEQAQERAVFILPLRIQEGSTFSTLMQEAGISQEHIAGIFEAAKDAYDLSNIREGKTLYLTFVKGTDTLLDIMYPISSEEELYVRRMEQGRASLVTAEGTTIGTTRELSQDGQGENSLASWSAHRVVIDYDIEIKTVQGEISTTLYEAGLAQGISESTIIELANVFQWSLDFAYDIQNGDQFIFIYEKRFRDGKYAHDGRILAAKFLNRNKPHLAYYFEEDQDNQGYFDGDGNSIQKMFLKAPVAYRYISSGFTTGRRYVQAFNVSTGHRAIDYAASYGTPIRAVGDGTVIFAGWSKEGYGYLTQIRHNATYATNYAHQSKIIVRAGKKVKQGQTIGSVGSTGFSTGPHVHFELVRNGVKVNPLTEILPPGKPIKQENKDRFLVSIEKYSEILNN